MDQAGKGWLTTAADVASKEVAPCTEETDGNSGPKVFNPNNMAMFLFKKN